MQLKQINNYEYKTKGARPVTLICDLAYEPPEEKIIERGTGAILEPNYPDVVYLVAARVKDSTVDIIELLDESLICCIESEVLIEVRTQEYRHKQDLKSYAMI